MTAPEQWVDKHCPKTMDGFVLPKGLTNFFSRIVLADNCPRLLFGGSPGLGKSSIARALANSLSEDVSTFNAGSIGDSKQFYKDIRSFAGSWSFTQTKKIIILDEASDLTRAQQIAIRNIMDDCSTCNFILTCNELGRVIPPMHSRCSVVNFNLWIEQERSYVLGRHVEFLSSILKSECVSCTRDVIEESVRQYFPDLRREINELSVRVQPRSSEPPK